MQTYTLNKILSLSAVFACIGLTFWWFGSTTEQWQAILLAIVGLGYGHFILGFLYQIKGFFCREYPWQSVATFVTLVILTVGFVYTILMVAGFVATLFIGFTYFLFHGLLNEQTLIERQTSEVVPLLFLGALAIFVMSLLTYSVPDQTFFFDRQLTFIPMNELLLRFAFESMYVSLEQFSYVFWVGMVSSLLLLFLAWFLYGYGKLTVFLMTTIVGVTGLVTLFGPPLYIYMYLLVVGYHFMTWLLFYLHEMKKRGKVQYRTFVVQNIAVLLPFIIGAYLFFTPQTPQLVYWLFDYQFFVLFTYIHISTSFMNDAWLQNMQSFVFTRLGLRSA